MLKEYNMKKIEMPHYTEYWFSEEPFYYGYQSKAGNHSYRSFEDFTYDEKRASILRHEKYVKEKKHYVRRIVDMNATVRTSFLTLTFSDNKQDLRVAHKEMDIFFKKLRRHLKNIPLKYIWVWELQKRGAIHYHVLLFDVPFIPIEKLRTMWPHGFIKINNLKEVIGTANIGRYIVKYFEKSFNENTRNIRSFACSRNLKKPAEEKIFCDDIELKVLKKKLDESGCYNTRYNAVISSGGYSEVKYYYLPK